MTAYPATDYPISADELGPRWLTEQLRGRGLLPPATSVVAVTPAAIGAGAGMMSNVFRIMITYSGPAPHAPKTLIAKFTTTNDANRAIGLASALYEREVSFFRVIAPTGVVPAPRCYASEFSAESGYSVLLLEDLDTYVPGDQIVGCSAVAAKNIIDSVVPLHAKYWEHIDDPRLGWVWAIADAKQVDVMAGACAASWDSCLEKFGAFMSNEFIAAKERFIGAIPRILQTMGTWPQTVIHGDVRLDNVMFSGAPARSPVVLVDWQMVLTAPGIYDIAYLISQNVVSEDRRRYETELVRHYHAGLVAHGITTYPAEQCWADYLLAELYLLSYPIIVCGGLDSTDERARRFMEAMISRASEAVTEHGSFSTLLSA